HLVGDRDRARALRDLIRIAVDRRHHRARNAARYAAVIKTPVGVRVRRPSTFARVLQRCRTLLRLLGQRRHAAVGRIRDEPCAAVRCEVILEPVHRARRSRKLAERWVALDRLLLALLRDLRELFGREAVEGGGRELRGPLERDAALVTIVVGAGDRGIAPGGALRLVRSARGQRRDLLVLRHFARLDWRGRLAGGAGRHGAAADRKRRPCAK